ncbi:hypothetical protein MMC09_005346 [Bachmanniomyces sp. S44760]|nr:hypothetical protein [Bachmanniomyces sp. S44760]
MHLQIIHNPPLSPPTYNNLRSQIINLERKTFPRSEALAIVPELAKNNTFLSVATENDPPVPNSGLQKVLVAYVIYARQKRLILLHKLCVAPKWQRQGIGRGLLVDVLENLKVEGREGMKMDLWVDERRVGARALYEGLGFELEERVEEYYGPTRTGLKMVLELDDWPAKARIRAGHNTKLYV